ncbi:MAG: sterol desaturase family protein [Cytophagales bacterium]|nr:sterol desaturase family protein [Bernardetiaceae bacterium]MDW8209785.1 sterol desaturase family protein [Cytophagales bacterium]
MNAPLYIKPKNSGTKQLFQHPVLERLTRTHIAVPISLFVTIAIVLVYYGATYTDLSIGQLMGLFFTGVVVFSFVEYNVHRYVFHMATDTPRKAKIQYTMHGVHHEYPKDKSRLAMPPVLSFTIAVILAGILYFLMGKYMFGFLPGFLVGYSAYLFIHYAVHAFAPPKNFLKILWIHHGIHHYKDANKAFGVSSPLWDWVFRTMP